MATDSFSNQPNTEWGPASNAVSVTPSDSADLTYTSRAVYVGGAGNMKATLNESGTVVFVAVAAGTLLPIRADRIWATDTTATSIVALW